MAGKLTDLLIKAAKPKEKRYAMFDTGGLYLEIAPNGSKWWRFRHVVNGKKSVLSFGVYPEASLKSARDKRDAARVLIANGGDPAKERVKLKEESNLPTFQSVAEEWLQIKSSAWSERHIKTVRLRVAKYLARGIPKKPFRELETADFIPVFREIEKRGKLETAKRAAQICGQICRFARLSGIMRSNPVEGVSEILIAPKTAHFKAITDLRKH